MFLICKVLCYLCDFSVLVYGHKNELWQYVVACMCQPFVSTIGIACDPDSRRGCGNCELIRYTVDHDALRFANFIVI